MDTYYITEWLNQQQNSWKLKILIVGGTGLIGSHLKNQLIKNKDERKINLNKI